MINNLTRDWHRLRQTKCLTQKDESINPNCTSLLGVKQKHMNLMQDATKPEMHAKDIGLTGGTAELNAGKAVDAVASGPASHSPGNKTF
jgi:hypothetical protein